MSTNDHRKSQCQLRRLREKIKKNSLVFQFIAPYVIYHNIGDPMTLYGLKTCDTCRKARKALDPIDFVDVRDDGVPADILTAAYAQFGERLLNTRSTTWRNLSENERSQEPMTLLQAHPTLMKRPLILRDEQMFLGWDKAVQGALLDA